jgi:hypothetical protein
LAIAVIIGYLYYLKLPYFVQNRIWGILLEGLITSGILIVLLLLDYGLK